MARDTRTGGRDATNAVMAGGIALSIGNPGTPLSEGFEWTPLSKLARLESGHTPSRARPEYWDGGVPWIGIRDATGNHGLTIPDTIQHISELGLENSSARMLPAGTVCLSRTASVGYVVIMGAPMSTSQDFVNWVCGPELSNQFLKYVLLLEQDSIRRFAYGSTHRTLYYPDAKALHVALPSRRYQDAVANVLGALDDKIAANASCLQDIDELASAQLESRICAESGWTKLGAVADVNSVTLKPNPGKMLRYIDIASVNVGGFDFPVQSSWDSAPSRARRGVRRGDTIWSTVRPNRRSHALVLSEDPELVASTGLAVLTPKQGDFAFVYEVTKLPEFTAFLEGAAEGSAYPAVRGDRFVDAPIPDLPTTIRSDFERVVAPMRKWGAALMEESRMLAELRDTLLPHLISGRVRVRDAEKQVEAVV